MKITKLILENYRMFKKATIPMCDTINVLYGKNGVGKSTVIFALNDLLYAITEKQGIPWNTPIIPSNRFNNPQKPCRVTIEAEIDGKSRRISAEKKAQNFETERRLSQLLPNQVERLVFPLDGGVLPDGTKFSGNLDDFKDAEILFSSFLPGRGVHKIETAVDSQGGIRFKIDIGSGSTMARGIRDFEFFKEWFENLEGEESQIRLEEDGDYRDSELEKLRNAIKALNPRFGRIKIDRKSTDKRLLVEKNGRFYDVLTQLSDGEVTIIALLGSIISSKTRHSGKSSHIILIDEIDCSLHPEWQAKISRSIKEAFPEAQVVASSHSPFVWSGLRKKEIIHLKSDMSSGVTVVEDVEYGIGGSVDAILKEFFDVNLYDEQVMKDIAEIESNLTRKNGDEARRLIREMKEKYGDLPIFSRFSIRLRGLGL